MEFRLLGPVEIHAANGQVIRLRRRQERLALAVLLLEPGRVVTAERLIDLLWEHSPPAATRTMVQTLMSRIRGALAAASDGGEPVRLVARGGGYLLHVEPESIDLHRFGRLVDEARATGDPDLRSARLAAALDLWRGPALADAATGAVRERLCGSLEESRFAALSDRIDAELDAGRHAELVAELSKLTDEHPLRERLHGQLMTALYRAGRRADALDAYRRARQILVAELGVEPGPQLRALHASIIADTADAGVEPGHGTSRTAAPAVPAQLPPDIAGCAGREAYLCQLDALLTAGPTATAPVTCVVTGPAGVGKTTLVVHWAHRVAARYPDGQIFLDMRGFHTGPRMSPAEALPLVLVALGVAAERIPLGLDAQIARYRSMVAGRRLLLVLDNVADPAQVRPLLPGSPGCLVVLTSRDRLGGLVALDGARRLTLDVLAPADAVEVLTHVAGAERVQADPAAVDELARLCAYLPLALRIAGARLADQPHRTVRGYVAELASAGRLAGLRVDDDDRACVRDAFGLSYRALSMAAQRMFRLLSLVPAPAGLSTAAAAALAAVPVPEAERMLDTIARLHLATTTAEGRYTCHDLLLEYAAELATATDPEADRDAAVRRLLDFYLYATEQSAALRFAPIPRLPRRPLSSGVPKLGFHDLGAARAWVAVEWDNLVAGVRHAVAAGPPDAVWHLVDAMNVHLILGEARPEWRLLVESGLAVATQAADPLAEAAMRYGLGLLCSRIGEFPDALEEHKKAVALYDQVAWRQGESIALRGSGVALVRLGRSREAIECFREALAIDREIGNLAGEAANLLALAAVHEELGELADAERCLTEMPAPVTGRRQHPAMFLGNLGLLRYLQGRLAEALDALKASVAMFRDIGARHSEGLALTTMGAVHRDAGRLPEATAAFAAALDIAHGTADAQLEVLAANGLSGVDVRLGRPGDAVARLDTALGIAERTGFLRGHVEALVALSEAHCAQGGFRLAHERAVDALAYARQSGSVVAVGNAHAAVADALLHLDDLEQCFVHARRALRIQRRAGQRLAQARTLSILGRAYCRLGREPAAAACARQARQLSEVAGALPRSVSQP